MKVYVLLQTIDESVQILGIYLSKEKAFFDAIEKMNEDRNFINWKVSSNKDEWYDCDGEYHRRLGIVEQEVIE